MRADCTDGSKSACQCSEFGCWASGGGGMALVGGEGDPALRRRWPKNGCITC